MSLAVSIDGSGVKAMFDKLGPMVQAAVEPEIKRYAYGWQRKVSKGNIGPGGKTRRGGKRLHNRTGALRRSVRVKHYRGRTVMMVGGRNAPHAVLQELGGTVRPRRRKYLTVPLPNALTASGAQSGKYRIREKDGKFVTDAGPTFVMRSKRGNLLIGVRRKNRKKVVLSRDLLYVLKREVTVPPRLRAWETARLDSEVGRALLKRLPAAIRRAEKEASS